MKKYLLILLVIFVVIVANPKIESAKTNFKLWEVQSIDTMKYSRDPSREKLNDPTFDIVIHNQIKEIADTGATHVAIGTAYDEEFAPIMKRWVSAARRQNLKVWFRGNWSGWEKWFGYKKITREEHLAKTKEFILKNKDLFEDGDIFSSCPECENGGPGDPRQNGDVSGHRKFLIDLYLTTDKAFKTINKSVESNYFSMNGDVAKLVMDEQTTKKLGGIVVVDHYVKRPEKLNQDLLYIAEKSKGKIILGEFGAPIPDIHGNMSEEEQSEWIDETMLLLSENTAVLGMNYWVSVGGSTEIFGSNGYKRKAVAVLSKYYKPRSVNISLSTDSNKKVKNSTITTLSRQYDLGSSSSVDIPYIYSGQRVVIQANGYNTEYATLNGDMSTNQTLKIIMSSNNTSLMDKFRSRIENLLR